MPPWSMLLSAGLGALFGLGLYVGGGGYLPFLAGLSSLRLREEGPRLRLAGLDSPTMFRAGFVAWALPGLLYPWGWMAWVPCALAAFVLWFGFRLRVVVSDGRTTVSRTVFWVIPWKRSTFTSRPSMFVDGWGDFADPEALHLSFGDDTESLELGWGHAGSGEAAEKIADEFNLAVGALRAAA